MSFVIKHAKENVWAEKDQDRDYYLQPDRITPNGGAFKYVEIGMNDMYLPNHSDRSSGLYYHVYHIGQLPSELLGIDVVENKWVGIDYIAEKLECYVNVFLSNGYVVPRSKCFFARTWPGKNIILAIENDTKQNYGKTLSFDAITNASTEISNTLNTLDVNIRFYTNDRIYSTTARGKAVNPDNQLFVKTDTLTRIKLAEIIDLNINKKLPVGWVVCNGLIRDLDNVKKEFTALQGKEFSAYVDETIISTSYHKLSDLNIFVSERNKRVKKFVIDLPTDPKKLVCYNNVEYFLGVKDNLGFRGVCIPMVRLDPITTVTNKTHAIRTDIITDLLTANDWINTSQDIHIMAVVRQGAVDLGLVHQHTRIEELFKLPTDIVNSTLSGVNALVFEWIAENLETDPYAQLIEASEKNIIEDTVFDAYGYNAITKYHHPNPLTVSEYTTDAMGKKWYSVQLSNVASERNKLLPINELIIEVLEYDTNGLFLGRKRFPYSNAGLLVVNHSIDTPVKTIEHYINTVNDTSLNLGEITSLTIDSNDLVCFGFAAYITTSKYGTTNPKWVDITNQNDYYYLTDEVIDGTKVKRFNWNKDKLNSINARPMVRINNRSCFKTFDLKDLVKTYRSFPTLTIPMVDGRVQVEPGSIEIWMEQRLLMENVDYYVRWPDIFIFKPPIDISTGKLAIRLSGLADAETVTHYKPRETGFVKDGILSINGNYDIRNDRNIQINVGGGLKAKEEVCFSEDGFGKIYEFDGRPYQIRDYITPVELYTSRSTAVEKAKSEEMDLKVMGYLNGYLTDKVAVRPSIADVRWHITSMFMDEIVGRVMAKHFGNKLENPWSSSDVDSWLEDLKFLLEIDMKMFSVVDQNYVKFIPHGRNQTVGVTPAEYKFLSFIAKHYFENKIQYNHLLAIV